MDLPFIKRLKGNLSGIKIKKYLVVNEGKSVKRMLAQSEEYEVNSLKEVLSYIRFNNKKKVIERHLLEYNRYSRNLDQENVWIIYEGQGKQFRTRYDIFSNQQVEEICNSMEPKKLGNLVSCSSLDSEEVCRVVVTTEEGEFYIFGNTYTPNGLPLKSYKYDLNRKLVLCKEYSYDEGNRLIELNVTSRTGRNISRTIIEYNESGYIGKTYVKGALHSVNYIITEKNDDRWENELKTLNGTVAADLRIIESDIYGNPKIIRDSILDPERCQFDQRYISEIEYCYMKPTNKDIKWQSKYIPRRIVDKYGYEPEDYMYSDYRKAYKADAAYNLDGTRKNTNQRTCRACSAYRGNNRCTGYPNTQLHEDWGCCEGFSPIIEYRMSHFWYNEKLLRRLGLYEIAASRYSDRYKSELDRKGQEALAFYDLSQKTGKSIKQILEELIGIK